MPVYKNQKTGKWYCVYRIRDIKGNLKQRRKDGFESRELAYKYECQMVSNNDVYKSKLKFKELYQAYIEHYKGIKAITTIDTYHSAYNKYFVEFEDIYVVNFTTNSIENHRRYVLSKNKDVSIDRINRVFKLLSRIFEYGIRSGLCNNNPCRCIEPLKDYSVKDLRIDFYTIDEFKHFISVVPKDTIFYIIFNVLYYTGLRSGELLALNVEDINLDNNIILINKTLTKAHKGEVIIKSAKTKASNGSVYIPATLREILKDYLKIKSGDPKQALFIYNKRRLAKRTLENKKNYYCDLSGLRRIRLHDFRHSFASLIYELSDYNLSEVAKRLRHSDISTVMKTYVHVFPKRKNAVDNKLDCI